MALVGAAVVAALLGLAGQSQSGEDSDPGIAARSVYTAQDPQCVIRDERLTGISGAASRPNSFWVVNDRGAVLYRLGVDCQVIAKVDLGPALKERDIALVDVEDLAATPDGWLWVADTGGNTAPREQVQMVGWSGDADQELVVANLRYPDGPQDVEAVIVTPAGYAVLVSKGSDGQPVRVYSTPDPLSDATQDLRFEGELTLPEVEDGGSAARQVTGASLAPNASYVTIRSYGPAWEYDVLNGDVAEALLTGEPRRVDLPSAKQGEAIAYGGDSLSLLATGEGRPVDLDLVTIERIPR